MTDLPVPLDSANRDSVCIDGRYVPARPYSGPWTWRIRAAWAVLRGRADAFTWPGGQ